MDLRGILLAILICAPMWGNAATNAADPNAPSDGKIQIDYPIEVSVPYRDRRPRHQFTANVQYENFAPTGYFSPVVADPTTVDASYKGVYNQEDIPLVGISLGYKFNMPFLGLEIAPFYGKGGLKSNRTGENINLDVEKYGVRFAAYLETLFKEPYIVPYVATQMQMWGIHETGATLSFNRTTAFAFGFGAGMLIQLNWLDPAAALESLNVSGLNNTYIDVFVQQYGDTADSADPVFASDFNWGVGLRLEY
ncbi:MAG: hypothetical protein KF767_04760 [Bdellovibrionaceae bacterium]|nr:hypothetical protein [Pseudobdellovibrionaceae bacterium]